MAVIGKNIKVRTKMKFDDEFEEFDKHDFEKSFLRWYVIGYFIGALITAIVIIILEVTK